ncbi:hypothetical protein FOL47_009991 [Perkinsus chesapeaki]|uniref:Cytochrome P450 n=1 Tax=Perkinsus chesapeaki TaxID=330153 RepID=A0A7J6L5E3_PERCH|nr:hypothetical protein FOL47_009991 [Perkinsus chesapeaki]
MCIHPDAQATARAELDALGRAPEDDEDINQLPYVEACILETLRMNNSTPGPMPYVTTVPYSIEGKMVSPGTVIIMMTGEAMKSEEYGGAEFRPENWFLPNSKVIDRERALKHWAFTGSPRRCPGQHLAMKECITTSLTSDDDCRTKRRHKADPAALCICYMQRRTAPGNCISDYKGPKGNPITGVALELDPDHALECMRTWTDQYGETIAFRVFTTPYVVTKNPETVWKIIRDSSKEVVMRQFNTLDLLPRRGLFLTDGHAWRLNRRKVDPVLAEPNVQVMIPLMALAARRLTHVLSALADEYGTVHDWEPHKLLQLAAFEFTMASNFGKDYKFLSPLDPHGAADREYAYRIFQDFYEGYDFVLKHIQMAPFIRNFFPFTLSKPVSKFYSSVERVEKFCSEIISQRRQVLKNDGKLQGTVLDKMIDMEQKDLTWNLVTFTLSGGSSVPPTVEWFLYLMCIHPDAQATARAELDALGRAPEDDEDINQLPYVEACILETLRMNNSTPGPMPYVTTVPYSIEGKMVSPGTVIIMMTGEAMKSEEYGGTEFRPEIWFLPNSKVIDREKALKHWAFTGSPRRCPGQHLAMKECIVLAATLLKSFSNLRLTAGCDQVGEITYVNRLPVNLHIDMTMM